MRFSTNKSTMPNTMAKKGQKKKRERKNWIAIYVMCLDG